MKTSECYTCHKRNYFNVLEFLKENNCYVTRCPICEEKYLSYRDTVEGEEEDKK